MALSPSQPILLLLASFFFLPALHAVNFRYCQAEGYDYGNITRVDISPNPVGRNDEPTITIFGFANKSTTKISRGRIIVTILMKTPSGVDIYRDLLITEFDGHDGEHGNNFKLSFRVPASEANGGRDEVTVTLIDTINNPKGPPKHICFKMFFPSKPREVLSSS